MGPRFGLWGENGTPHKKLYLRGATGNYLELTCEEKLSISISISICSVKNGGVLFLFTKFGEFWGVAPYPPPESLQNF